LSLFRSNLTVATGTALSRITGLLRVVVFGIVIGQTALADAYKIGNETPNIVYELLLGGVLSATLVPLFTSYLERDDDESTNAIVTVASVAMVVVTAIAVLAAPLIFGLYSVDVADGVDADAFREAGTMLTRIFLLQIFFYGITAIASALLNSRRRFFAAAWTPVLANLVTIGALLSLPDPDGEWLFTDVIDDRRLRYTLGFGTTLGIAVMAVVLVIAVRRAGVRYRPLFDLRHPAVKKLAALSGWTLGYVIANQVSIVVVRNLADPGSGNASAYFDAYTFFVLPHGLLAVSIATTFVPEMARSVARRERGSFIRQASLGIRLITLLTLPAGVLIFVLRRPIIGALLQHGEYTDAAALNTSRALAGFALGLVGFSVYLFVLRGFYAHHDTRSPFIINVVENVINIVLAVVLVDEFGVLGLGAAFAIAYIVCSVWALNVLSYKVPGFPMGEILGSLWRMLVAAVLGGEVAWFVARAIGDNSGGGAWMRVIVASVAGLATYAAMLVVLRAPEVDAVRRRLPARLA
jgi:putative peptidoglycan lipid II flippase